MTALIPQLVRASDIRPVAVSWLWTSWLPVGKLVLLEGDPGCGKSSIAIDLAARLTSGSSMPTGQGVDPAGVVILNAEDGIEDTVRPRLDAAGADCERVHLWDWQSVLPRLPDSADWLADRIVEHEVKLVILDTLTTFLDSGINSHRDQDVRRALIPLVKTASESGTAVLAVRHLNKGQQSSAMHRGMGSMAFTGLARAVWHAGPHPDEDAMVLAAVKNNLAQNAHAMRYRVSDSNGAPVVTWEGPCDLVADDLIAQPASTPSAVTEAVEWLEEQLTGHEVPSTQLQQDAFEAGISHATYRRARKHLDVTSTRRADQHWSSLPAQPAQHQVPEQVEQAG